jgi:hypothetical protein
MLGADCAEAPAPTTAAEVSLRFRELEDELQKRQTRLEARDLVVNQPSDVPADSGISLR